MRTYSGDFFTGSVFQAFDLPWQALKKGVERRTGRGGWRENGTYLVFGLCRIPRVDEISWCMSALLSSSSSPSSPSSCPSALLAIIIIFLFLLIVVCIRHRSARSRRSSRETQLPESSRRPLVRRIPCRRGAPRVVPVLERCFLGFWGVVVVSLAFLGRACAGWPGGGQRGLLEVRRGRSG